MSFFSLCYLIVGGISIYVDGSDGEDCPTGENIGVGGVVGENVGIGVVADVGENFGGN